MTILAVGLLDGIPLWLLFPLSCAVVVACSEIGFRLGRLLDKGRRPEEAQSVSVAVGAVLGLLAFMLAFTFNTAASRVQDRRLVLIDETNSIETTYLRAGLLADPERSEVRQLLREYVDNRLGLPSKEEAVRRLERSDQIKKALWEQEIATAAKSSTQATILFTETLNEMIDLDTKRTTVVTQHRTPDTIWIALIVLTILGLGSLGYLSGLYSSRRSPTIIVVTLTFAIVITMIADLDNPGAGLLRVDQTPMYNLKRSLDTNP